MGAFYRKYRRIFLAFFVANVLISMLQLVFAYGHLIKHEWWTMCLSLFFVAVNGWTGWSQYKNWQRVIQEEKEYMWKTLSTPGGDLR